MEKNELKDVFLTYLIEITQIFQSNIDNVINSDNIYFLDDPNQVYYIERVNNARYNLITETVEDYYIKEITIVLNGTSYYSLVEKKICSFSIFASNINFINIDVIAKIYKGNLPDKFFDITKSFQFKLHDKL